MCYSSGWETVITWNRVIALRGKGPSRTMSYHAVGGPWWEGQVNHSGHIFLRLGGVMGCSWLMFTVELSLWMSSCVYSWHLYTADMFTVDLCLQLNHVNSWIVFTIDFLCLQLTFDYNWSVVYNWVTFTADLCLQLTCVHRVLVFTLELSLQMPVRWRQNWCRNGLLWCTRKTLLSDTSQSSWSSM